MKLNKISKIILITILFLMIHIVSVHAISTEDIAFDSDYYLEQYKDIQDAIGNHKDRLKSHFDNYGIYEGRKSSLFFDVRYYLNRYEDIAQAYGNDFAGAYRHFIQYGLNEGRMGAPGFDVDYYLSHNPDVKEKYPTRISAYEHFINYGIYEGRTTTSGFHATYYLLSHTDLQNAFGDNKFFAFKHFIDYGIYEGRISSSNYDGTWYLNQYKDLQNNFGNNYVLAYNHYLTCGIQENRQAISQNRVDLVAPLISGVKNETIYVKLNDPNFILPSATAEDAIDGKVEVKVTGEVNIQKENTYQITYTATDHAQNTSSVTLTVVVTASLPATKTIENGIYKIESGLNSNFVLDISGGFKTDSANLQIWNYTGVGQQKFSIIYLGNGYYEIKAVHSGKVLDVTGAGTVNGTNVCQYASNRSDAQQWIIKDAGDGYYNIISKCNDLFLDVAGALTSNGTNVQVYAENGSHAQKFKFTKVPTLDNNIYKIAIRRNPNMYFDVSGGSTAENANLHIWNKASVFQQLFQVEYVTDQYCRILSKNSNKVLTVNHDNLVQATYNGSDTQLWYIEPAIDGYYCIGSKSNGKFIDVAGDGSTNGVNLGLYNYNSSPAQMFQFQEFTDGEIGYYGQSGLIYKGDSRGSNLTYYQYGCGPNVLFATFTVHGYEDKWSADGQTLVNIANNFYNRLLSDKDKDIAINWTVYIFPEVNPDGLRVGYSHNGPGRTTLFSFAPGNRGIDLNRCWQINGVPYKIYTSDRNYNGTSGFQAYEAVALRDFLLSHKSEDAQTILIDLHGWENQLIGDADICNNFYYPNFPTSRRTGYNSYVPGYLISWARASLGSSTSTARSALIELPTAGINSYQDVVNHNLINKYIDSTLTMLHNVGLPKKISYLVGSDSVENTVYNSPVLQISEEEQLKIAIAGMIKQNKPEENEIDNLYAQIPEKSGIWIEHNSTEKVLNTINQFTNFEYGIDKTGYLTISKETENKNEYDELLEKMINGNKQYLITISGNYYTKDIITGEIQNMPYEDLDSYQTYDYIETNDKMMIFLPENQENKIEKEEIMNSLLLLIKQ